MNIAEILKQKLEKTNLIKDRLNFRKNFKVKGIRAQILNNELQNITFISDIVTYQTLADLHITIEMLNKHGEPDMHIITLLLNIDFTLDAAYEIYIKKIIRITPVKALK